jgi:hypothetical protein
LHDRELPGKEGILIVTIEDTAERLYSLLLKLGPGWHDRAELAKKLGKNKLNPVEAAALDLLASAGRVERVTQQAGTGNITRFVYQVKEGKPRKK